MADSSVTPNCKQFSQGTCRYGNKCKFIHHYKEHKCTDKGICKKIMEDDRKVEIPSFWKLSCYGHFRELPNDVGGDISQEELRAQEMDAIAAGSPLGTVTEGEKRLFADKALEFQNLPDRNPAASTAFQQSTAGGNPFQPPPAVSSPFQTGFVSPPAFSSPFQTGLVSPPAVNSPFQAGFVAPPAVNNMFQPGYVSPPAVNSPFQTGFVHPPAVSNLLQPHAPASPPVSPFFTPQPSPGPTQATFGIPPVTVTQQPFGIQAATLPSQPQPAGTQMGGFGVLAGSQGQRGIQFGTHGQNQSSIFQASQPTGQSQPSPSASLSLFSSPLFSPSASPTNFQTPPTHPGTPPSPSPVGQLSGASTDPSAHIWQVDHWKLGQIPEEEPPLHVR